MLSACQDQVAFMAGLLRLNDMEGRIAIGGFQHKTNTFAPSKACFEHYRL